MRMPASPARMLSRISRRTAMIPPWPVSPSIITGIETLSAIQPAIVDAFGHRRGADIGEPGIGADHAAGADEQRLATGLFHDPGMRRARRMQYRKHLVAAMDQLLEPGCGRSGHDANAFADFRAIMSARGMRVEQDFRRVDRARVPRHIAREGSAPCSTAAFRPIAIST